LKTSVKRQTDAGNDAPLDITASTDRLTYSSLAPSVKGQQPKPYMKTYLALRNKETNEVKMVEANVAVLGAIVEEQKSTNPLLAEENAQETRQKMKSHLVSKFGQAKGKRVYEQKERSKVDDEDIEEKVAKAAESVDAEALETEATQEVAICLTPKMNREASIPSEVFDVDEFLSKDEIKQMAEKLIALAGECTDKKTTEWVLKRKRFSQFFKSTFNAAMRRTGRGQPEQSLCLALYSEALAQFSVRSDSQLTTNLLDDYLPIGVKARFMKDFTQKK